MYVLSQVPLGETCFISMLIIPVEQRYFAFDGIKQVELLYGIIRFLSWISEYHALPGGGCQAMSRW